MTVHPNVLPASVEILLQGYPGRSTCHGGLGWSTVALLRHAGRVALIDVASFGARRMLVDALAQRGIAPGDVTDVLLTHAHYDHSINWTLFRQATIAIGRIELAWAAAHPDDPPLPELYVDALARHPRLRILDDGETVLPELTAHHAPGHTPGHLCYLFDAAEGAVLFTGDAAKNRAELRSHRGFGALDARAGAETLRWIDDAWRRRPGTVVVPGHDVPLTLDAAGVPQYAGTRSAAMLSWFGDTLDDVTTIDLTEPG